MRTEKQRYNTQNIKLLVALGDLFWGNLIFFLMNYLCNIGTANPFDFVHAEGFKTTFVMLNMAYMISQFYCGVILDQRIVSAEKILELVANTVTLFAALFLAACFVTGNTVFPTKYWILFFTSIFVIAAIWRLTFRAALSE